MRISGKYGEAVVFTENIEAEAIKQVEELLNQEFVREANVRIMPDVHSGKGCVIGTTMRITNAVCPNLVGVDIGCGMSMVNLGEREIDFQKLDQCIHDNVPVGFNVREEPVRPIWQRQALPQLHCIRELQNIERLYHSLGTLGGGNHFIEIDKNPETDEYFLIVHSGSRNLGKQVAEYYQNVAVKICGGMNHRQLINELKSQNREAEIEAAIKEKKKNSSDIPPHLAYLKDELLWSYLHDMHIVQQWASMNRNEILENIIVGAFPGIDGLYELDQIETVHNYIGYDNILRKGAVSAKDGERFILPMNMRDGVLICKGKGNPDWNWSAPHGAGRIMSRSAAKKKLSLDQFKDSMQNIYSTTVTPDTLDEAPMAYKPMDEIIQAIADTATIEAHLIPVYNFKGV